jgi:hypothetical protein
VHPHSAVPLLHLFCSLLCFHFIPSPLHTQTHTHTHTHAHQHHQLTIIIVHHADITNGHTVCDVVHAAPSSVVASAQHYVRTYMRIDCAQGETINSITFASIGRPVRTPSSLYLLFIFMFFAFYIDRTLMASSCRLVSCMILFHSFNPFSAHKRTNQHSHVLTLVTLETESHVFTFVQSGSGGYLRRGVGCRPLRVPRGWSSREGVTCVRWEEQLHRRHGRR